MNTTTQRIEKVTNPQGKAAELLEGVKKALGSTPNLFTTFANAPAAMEGYLGLNGALAAGKLGAKTRESIALAVAGFNGCDYCASAHTYLGENLAGLSADETTANLRGESSDPKTQAALVFAGKLLERRGRTTQADLDEVRAAGHSDEEIIEILTHVALNTLTNYFNEAFGVEIDFPRHVSTVGAYR
jgi:uncharacterized peroxidase-related enzyme